MGEVKELASAMATAQPVKVRHTPPRQPPEHIAVPVYQSLPMQQVAYASDTPPPKGNKYAAISTGGYIGMMILFAIPIVGWLACIIMALAAGNRNRRSFARATLVFLIVSAILAMALYFMFQWVWEAAQEYIQQYGSGATGGQVTDFNGLKDFFDIFKRLNGLEIPTLPDQ
jgi:hypothetical protein